MPFPHIFLHFLLVLFLLVFENTAQTFFLTRRPSPDFPDIRLFLHNIAKKKKKKCPGGIFANCLHFLQSDQMSSILYPFSDFPSVIPNESEMWPFRLINHYGKTPPTAGKGDILPTDSCQQALPGVPPEKSTFSSIGQKQSHGHCSQSQQRVIEFHNWINPMIHSFSGAFLQHIACTSTPPLPPAPCLPS